MAEDYVRAVEDSLFREVSEEVRQEQIKKLWDKYGLYVIVLFVASIVFASGFEGWKSWRDKIRQKDSNAFEAVLMNYNADGDKAKAIKSFEEVSLKANTGYRDIAVVQQANLLLQGNQKDVEDGVNLLLKASKNKSLDIAIRSAAAIAYVNYKIDDAKEAEIQALEEMLAPFTEVNNPWRGLSLEAQALLAIKGNNNARAKEILLTIADDASAPEGVRTRARELVSVIDVK